MPQTPSERYTACEYSCLQPKIHLPQGGLLHRTDPTPQSTCTTAAGNALSRHCLQKLQECWRRRKELLANQAAPAEHMATTLGPKCKMLLSCLSSTVNNQKITYSVLNFPKFTLHIDQELLRLRITSLAQFLPAPLITTSVFLHVSILEALNYIASNTEVADLKSRTCPTVLLVLLLLYLTCNSNFSSFFRM